LHGVEEKAGRNHRACLEVAIDEQGVGSGRPSEDRHERCEDQHAGCSRAKIAVARHADSERGHSGRGDLDDPRPLNMINRIAGAGTRQDRTHREVALVYFDPPSLGGCEPSSVLV